MQDKRFTLHHIFTPTLIPLLEETRTQPDLLEAYIDAAIAEDGAEPTARDLMGRTALGNAIYYNNTEGMRVLLGEIPELLNIPTDAEGSLPWSFAIKEGKLAAVKFFVQNKDRLELEIYPKNLEIKRNGEVNALSYACYFSRYDIAEFLITQTKDMARWGSSYIYISAVNHHRKL